MKTMLRGLAVVLLLCATVRAEIIISAVADSAGKPAVTVGYDLSDVIVRAKSNVAQAEALKQQAKQTVRMAEWAAIDAKPWIQRWPSKLWFHVSNAYEDHPVAISSAALVTLFAVAEDQGWIDMDFGGGDDTDGSSNQEGSDNTQVIVNGNGNNITVEQDSSNVDN